MASPVLELESTIKGLPGVLGCVIMTDPSGSPAEIQAFVRSGVDQERVRVAIEEAVQTKALSAALRQVFVFELEAESHFGDRESLHRAAELAEQDARARGPVSDVVTTVSDARAQRPAVGGARPMIERVVLTSSSWSSESQVSLSLDERLVSGTAEGEKTPHGLRVVAQATLDAAEKLTRLRFELEAASVVTIGGREAVLALVRAVDGLETLGAALVRTAPVTEVTVRATLAAINRRLAQA